MKQKNRIITSEPCLTKDKTTIVFFHLLGLVITFLTFFSIHSSIVRGGFWPEINHQHRFFLFLFK
jgi:hypothetical protein